MTTLLDHALSYAAAGFSVLPLHTPVDGRCDCRPDGQCEHPGKHPRTTNGLRGATTDVDAIRRWWGMWPTANVGIAIPDTHLVVDVDVPEVKSALGGRSLPTTALAKTGRGWQFLYRVNRPVRPAVGVLPHVDFRGIGSYIVAPPSIHANGAQYVWIAAPKDGIADAPDWVYAMTRPTPNGLAEPGAAILDGGRNAALTTMAGAMRRQGMTPAEMETALQAVNAGRCRPPLTDAEVRAIARSVGRYTPDPDVMIPSTQEHEPAAGLRFYTPVELATMTLVSPTWIVPPGYVAIGSITELDGKIKSAGKTTLILGMVAAILDGAPFLGADTRRSRVLYVTEQSRQTFADALRRAGLEGRGDELRILFREDIGATTWPAVVGAARQDGYEVCVFDTIGKLARIKEENSAGEWSAAMEPLQDLAASGRAVIIARHDRKGGGEVGDSGRGSSQASGDVDIILAIRRPEGHQPSTRRVIESLSRYPETPEKIVVELTETGYVLLGTQEAVAATDALAFLSAAIGAEYRQKHSGLDIKALEVLGAEHEPVVKRTTIQAALDRMVREGEIVKTGAGKRGDPYLYMPAESVSAETRQVLRQKETSVLFPLVAGSGS